MHFWSLIAILCLPFLLVLAWSTLIAWRVRSGKWAAPWQREQAEAMKAAAKALERIAGALEKRPL